MLYMDFIAGDIVSLVANGSRKPALFGNVSTKTFAKLDSCDWLLTTS